MADDGDRTEAATPHRRSEARNRGQVARSQDLAAAVLLLTGLLMLDFLGRGFIGRLAGLTRYCLAGSAEFIGDATAAKGLFGQALKEGGLIVLPFMLAVFVAAAVVVLLQVGFMLSGEPVKPDLNKINPVNGLKRLLSMHLLAQSGINVGKLIVVSAVVFFSVSGELERIVFASTLSFVSMVGLAAEIFFQLGIRVAVALIILGIIDWMYQRHRHEKSIKMTKQEVKDELKRMDGDPIMKRRRREAQMKLAMQNLRRTVPEADVVVTNPTQLAVALKYDPETMAAPRVVAKGEGIIAQRIRQLAHDVGVPVVERKPLARALYRLTEAGDEVPQELYKAVAEVLAYVYQLSGRQPSAA